MRKLSELILEAEYYPDFVIERHCIDDEDYQDFLNRNVDSIWNILQEAYSDKDGFFGLQSKGDLKRKIKMIKIACYKGQPVAVSIYNPYIPELKCVGIGAVKGQFHRQGVVGVKLIIRDDVVNWEKYTFLEADSQMEDICKEAGGFNLPNVYVENLLNRKIECSPDGFHYSRLINNIEVTKTIFGIPNKKLLDTILEKHFDWFNNYLNNIDRHIIKIDYSKFNESGLDYSYSEIDGARKKIYTFYNNYLEEGFIEYSKELIEILRKSIETVKRLFSANQYDKNHGYLYNMAVEDGEEVLSKLIEYKPVIFRL